MTPTSCIVIPVYKALPDDYEQLALRRCANILGQHALFIVCPTTLDTTPYTNEMPQADIKRFDPTFFDSIQGYNRLMLSPDFYATFSRFDYMLIYQLDAYVFSDQLDYWTAQGYDYIGAPWVLKDKYSHFPYNLYFFLQSGVHQLIGVRRHLYVTANRVGNGGFSLRRIAACYDSVVKQREMAQQYIERCTSNSLYNEDVFFSLGVKNLHIPDVHTAIRFSIDTLPEQCLKHLNGQMPFGCHGWTRPYTLNVWKKYIPAQ